MSNEWYYMKDGNAVGPVGASEIKQLALAGALLSTDLIRKDGMSDWVRASSVRGLFRDAQVKQSPIAATAQSAASPAGQETATSPKLTWNDRFLNKSRELCEEWANRAGGAGIALRLMKHYIVWIQALCGARLPDGCKQRPTKGLYTLGMCMFLVLSCGVAGDAYQGIRRVTKTTYTKDREYIQVRGRKIMLREETTTERKMFWAERAGGYVCSAALAGAACWCLYKRLTCDRAGHAASE